MCYQSGRDLTVQSKSWDLESRAWYVDPDACFPPVFAEKGRATRYGNAGTEVCPVKAIPCWEGNSVRWDGGTYTLEEWRQKLTGWHNAFPNIIKDGSTPWETASFRSSQTSKVEIIKQCFGKCKRPTWPSTLTKASREFLQRFRVDMWGNMICLPTTAKGGRADNESLCFFDVDHTFPWSRGGRSTNFAGVQWGANNKKRDKIIQGMDLGPECASKLQVGLSPDAFVTLFMFCDQVLPHTRQNVRALQDRAVYFLRGSPMVGQAKVNLAETLGHDDEKALASLDPARLWELFDQHMNPLPWLGACSSLSNTLATHQQHISNTSRLPWLGACSSPSGTGRRARDCTGGGACSLRAPRTRTCHLTLSLNFAANARGRVLACVCARACVGSIYNKQWTPKPV
jgi:hypothetical protein